MRFLLGGIELVVRVAGDVQPVSPPSLAVARRREQPVHDLGKGIGTGVLEERVHVLRSRRQAGQVERGAANQNSLVGRPRRFEALGFQLREYEIVDRIPHPGRVLHLWNGRLAHLLKRPECALVGGDHVIGSGRFALGDRAGRPYGPGLYPLGDGRNLFVFEFAARRHLETGMGLPDRLNQQAVLRFARHDWRTGLTAFPYGIGRIQPQPSHLRIGMAGIAVARQDRAHLAFEEFAGVCTRGPSGQQSSLAHKQDDSHKPLQLNDAQCRLCSPIYYANRRLRGGNDGVQCG